MKPLTLQDTWLGAVIMLEVVTHFAWLSAVATVLYVFDVHSGALAPAPVQH